MRELDGLALAIEMAAARAPMFGVQQLAASMPDRLRLLTDGRNRAAPARPRMLRATLEWSHGFLDDTERTVFRRLAVFAGSGSLAMVRRVLADDTLDEWAVLEALALLVDRSLVVALTLDEGTEPRYRLLNTPRLFALERLREAGEEEAPSGAHGPRDHRLGLRRCARSRDKAPRRAGQANSFAGLQLPDPGRSAEHATWPTQDPWYATIVAPPCADLHHRQWKGSGQKNAPAVDAEARYLHVFQHA